MDDLWVVAAVVGAGYLAKYWQNFLPNKECSSGFPFGNSFHDNAESPSLIQRIRDKICPIRKLSRRKTAGRNCTETGSENYSDGLSAEKQIEKYEDSNMSPSSVFSPEFSENFEELKDGYRLDTDMGDIREYNTWEMGTSHCSRRCKISLRGKRLHLQFIKPRSSLDSCLVAQMYRKHTEMDGYVRSSLSSPCTPSLSPFLVTDGTRVISRAGSDARYPMHNEGNNQMGKSSNTRVMMQYDSPGPSSGLVLFCLGISIGIMSTIVANKLKVEKLKECLKQSQISVQNLQDKLEIKDLSTFKELVHDGDSHEISDDDEKIDSFPNQADSLVLIKCADQEPVNLKKDTMSKIEEELQAELERLELSMKRSTLRGGSSDVIEFDQDIMVELVHGELKADIFQEKFSSEPTPDQSAGNNLTPHSAKDGVSPFELSVRLHEVIQSRLEDQIMELELKLAKTRERVSNLESKRINSRRVIPNSEPEIRPGVLHLSQDEVSRVQIDNRQDNLFLENQDPYGRHNGFENGIMTCPAMSIEEVLPNSRIEIPSNECSPKSNGYDDEDGGDYLDLLLIKQIVEKARQGSPTLLKAQRAMVSFDRDEY